MSFPRYPSYKTSGVEWLGHVPKHWVVCLSKRFVTVKSGDMINATEETDSGYPLIGGNGIRAHTNEWNSPGDTLVIGRVGAKCGCVHHIKENFWASEHAFRVIEKQPLSKRFFFHLLSALELNKFAIKTAQPLLNTEIVETQWISVPPVAEQAQIATFLDRETAKIDALVAEQRRLMELLKEKRQAVISHAVTRGLNPDAPMKPSGVEWLGNVPAHWAVRRLSSLTTKITNGYVGPTRDILKDEGVRYLQSLHIKRNQIQFNAPYFVSKEWSLQHAKSILEEGDVLIVQTGDIGQSAVVTKEFVGCNCHALIILAPVRSQIEGAWISWILNSDYGFHTLLSIQTGALHPHLNCGEVKNVAIPLPSLAEQREIVKYVADRSKEFDTLTAEAQRAIDLLQERRTALISAAVTGQIDVCGVMHAGTQQVAT